MSVNQGVWVIVAPKSCSAAALAVFEKVNVMICGAGRTGPPKFAIVGSGECVPSTKVPASTAGQLAPSRPPSLAASVPESVGAPVSCGDPVSVDPESSTLTSDELPESPALGVLLFEEPHAKAGATAGERSRASREIRRWSMGARAYP